ncbi:trypsin-like serine protease [Sorangium sp. So ce375]|uniref:trypsin-like serine protease n=1 Tax=Sorangium sp. So ce375 TaxID=3133306 RepID=UPI003F5C876F
MKTSTLLARRSLVKLLVAGLAAASHGCSEHQPEDEDIAEATQEIIGGSAVSVATRRNLGLVDVIPSGCSASLISRDWVLTATHCLDFSVPTANWFAIPRADGTLEVRSAVAADRVGPTDITVVELSPVNPGSEWPNVTREMYPGSPSALVGQNVTCYGQGYTAYDTPDGLTAGGNWRSLTRAISSYSDGLLVMTATNTGTQITAPGDSGGPCIFGGETVGIVSYGDWVCADQTDKDTCKSTITKILSASFSSTTQFKEYIDAAPLRPSGASTATFRPLALEPGWIAHPISTNDPGAAPVGNAVHLRGAIRATGNNPVAFTLPAGLRPSADVYVPTSLCNAKKGRLWITAAGVVTVQTESGGSWSDAQCFTSLDGVSFVLDNAPLNSIQLVNNWTNAPLNTRSAAYRVVNGVVRLRGAIANGTSPYPFTLDQEAWPLQTTYIPVDLCGGTKGRLIIATNGVVFIQAFGSFTDAQCITSLEGVSFHNDGSSLGMWPQNGWTPAFGGPSIPVAKNIGGIVRLAGAIETSGTDPWAFTLPVEYSPATEVYIPVDMCSAQKGRLHIYPNGRVLVSPPAGAWSAAQCFTSLDGAWFGL